MVQISTAFMIFFSIFGLFYPPSSCLIRTGDFLSFLFEKMFGYDVLFAGKFGAFFASIPLPIFAAIYCVLYGIVGEYYCLSCMCALLVSGFKEIMFCYIVQRLLGFHSFNLRTTIPCGTFTYWASLCSLEYQYHNILS